jgi:high-affinity iron transporter
MLTWHNVWMASHGRAIAQEMRQVGVAVAAGQKPLAALSVVCGVAVLREGSEVVLFLYGIAAAGGTSATGMMAGGALGVLAGAATSALMYLGLLTIPARYLFSVTSGLITLLAAGLAAQAVAFLQQAGYVETLTFTVWDTSWLLSDGSVIGRLVHTLIGYTDRPSGAQLVVYLLTIAIILGLMRSQRPQQLAVSCAKCSLPRAPDHSRGIPPPLKVTVEFSGPLVSALNAASLLGRFIGLASYGNIRMYHQRAQNRARPARGRPFVTRRCRRSHAQFPPPARVQISRLWGRYRALFQRSRAVQGRSVQSVQARPRRSTYRPHV